MKDSIGIGEKMFISARRASEITKYTADYIGQLCRGDKIPARMVGRTWFVDQAALLKYKKSADLQKRSNSEYQRDNDLSGVDLEKPKFVFTYSADDSPLLPELKKSVRAVDPSFKSSSVDKPVRVNGHAISPSGRLVSTLVMVSFLLVGTVGMLKASSHDSPSDFVRHASEDMARIMVDADDKLAFLSDKASQLTWGEIGGFFQTEISPARTLDAGSRNLASIGTWWSSTKSWVIMAVRSLFGINNQDRIVKTEKFATSSVIYVYAPAPLTNTIIIPSIPASPLSSGGQPPTSVNNTYTTVYRPSTELNYRVTALEDRQTPDLATISNLVGQSISNAFRGITFGGGGGGTTVVNNTNSAASALTGVVEVDNGGTGISTAPTFGQLLVGNSSGGYDLTATSSLGISGSGTVTLVSTNNGLTGSVSTTGTIGLDLTGISANNTLLTWNGTRLAATGTQLLTVGNIIATSTATSTLPRLSATGISADWICLTGDICRSTWPTGSGSSSGYPFALAGNATSTLTQFNGGLTAFASSTIGDGTQGGGLTISGGATTTGDAYFAGRLGIGTTSPSENLSVVGNVFASSNVIAQGISMGGNNGLIFNSSASNGQLSVFNSEFLNFSFGGSPLLGVNKSTGNVGIGTTSPYAKLSVVGPVVAEYFNATSTTATSTFQGGLSLTNGTFQQYANGVTSIENLETGTLNFETNAGTITWADLPVTSSAPDGTVESYTASIGGLNVLTVYGKSNGAGGVKNLGVGIGTTSPWRALSVEGSSDLGIDALAGAFTATSTRASVLPYASTTALTVGGTFWGAGLTNCSASNKLIWSNGLFICDIDVTSSGGVGGTWSTTTSQVAGQNVNYSNNSTDIVAIGNLSTTSAKFWFDPNTSVGFVSGNLGIGTTSPYRQLSVGNAGVFGGNVTAASFTATSTTATSTLPLLASVGLSTDWLCLTGDICRSTWPTGSGSSFGKSWEINAFNALAPTTTIGIIVSASSTIGNGTLAGGLTVNGGATTTGTLNLGNPNVTHAIINSRDGFMFNSDVDASGSDGSFRFSTDRVGTSGGTELLSIIANGTSIHGNVGIGTTSPYRQLSVGGSAVFGANVLADSFTATSTTATSTFAGGIDAARVCLTGTTICLGPTSGYPFALAGNATSTLTQFNGGLTAFASSTIGNGTQGGGLTILGGATTTGNAYFAGYIGIGTTTPWAQLSVNSSGNDPSFVISSSTAPTFTNLIVTNGGRVGIGNSNPSEVLSVNGSVRVLASVNGGFAAYDSVTGGNHILSLTRTGNNARLSTFGNILFVTGSGSTLTGGTQQMTIQSSGNVGIGTTTPYRNLSVGGSAVFGDNVLAASFTATSTTATSTFAGGIDAARVCLTGTATCLGSNAGLAGYPFPLAGNATSTLTQFNGGLTAFASSTIGDGTQGGGLTISGGATTTGNLNLISGKAYKYNNTNVLTAITSLANYFFGPAGNLSMSGSNNIGIGLNAVRLNTTGVSNIGLGTNALAANDSATSNIGIGTQALFNAVSGGGNVAIGTDALLGTISGANNTAVGLAAGNGSTGSNNLFLGASTGQNLTSGSNNIIIGYNINTPDAGSGNTLNIGNLIYGTGINGSGSTLSSGNVGIGTTSPYAKLSVVGSVVAEYFSATSTTATSTFAGALSFTNGTFQHYASGVTSIENLETGTLNFETNAGWVTWADLAVTAAAVSSTTEAYSASIGGNPIFTVYGQSDGAGGVKRTRAVIGTSTDAVLGSENIPYSSLVIADGALCVDNGSGATCASSVRTRGFIYAEGSSVAGLDLAELYPSDDDTLMPGTLLMLDGTGKEKVKRYDPASGTKLFGVISSDPGVLLGGFRDTSIKKTVPVALAGRVPVKVNLEGGSISIGDLISPSSVPGVGKRATASGYVIGSALESYPTASGTDMISVFVETHYAVLGNEFVLDAGSNGPASSTLAALLPGGSSPLPDYAEAGAVSDLIAGLNARFDGVESELLATVSTLASTSAALASTTDLLDSIANFDMSTTTASGQPSFIGRIAERVKEIIAQAGEWVLTKITATLAIFDRVEVGTAAVSKGLEMKDQTTGQVYCVTINNGEWDKSAGGCSQTIATSTPITLPSVNTPEVPIIPPIVLPILPVVDATSTDSVEPLPAVATSSDPPPPSVTDLPAATTTEAIQILPPSPPSVIVPDPATMQSTSTTP